jgi:hypothetical protein
MRWVSAPEHEVRSRQDASMVTNLGFKGTLESLGCQGEHSLTRSHGMIASAFEAHQTWRDLLLAACRSKMTQLGHRQRPTDP